jgi:hypothetical protein
MIESTSLPPHTTSNGRRIAAGILGVAALAFVARYTVGGALLAPVGIFVARLLTRRGNRRLSRPWSWFAAVVAVEIALLGVGAYAAMHAPPGTLSQIQHATDSAQRDTAGVDGTNCARLGGPRASSKRRPGRLQRLGTVVGGIIVSG